MASQSEVQLRLKGNFFADPEFFRTDVTRGVTRTPTGTRICTLPSDFLLGFRDALVYECGAGYRPVMKAAGKRWGTQFIKRLDRELTAYYQAPFKDLPTGVIRTTLAEAFNYHGYGCLALETLEEDPEFIVAELLNPLVPSLVRESDRPVDLLMAGMLGSVLSHITGRSLDCVQTECPSLGADRSRFLIGPVARIAEVEQRVDASETMPTHEEILGWVKSARFASAAVPV